MRPLILLILFTTIAVQTAQAKVIESSDSAFTIEIQSHSSASPSNSYAQFVRVQDWWDPDHSWFGKAENFSLEARAGGCFCEIDGDRQVEHMRVVFTDPGKELRMLGGLGPLQTMGLHGVMSWKFEPNDEGGTRITQRYVVVGNPKANLQALAPVVDSVQSQQQSRLMQALKN